MDTTQANFDAYIAKGKSVIGKHPLNRSKAMMFEDLVLQSITYENDTIKLTIPDYLPQNQMWKVTVLYWNMSEGYDYTNRKIAQFTEPGDYTVSDVKIFDEVEIYVEPINDDDYVTSRIGITNRKGLSLDRLDAPEVSFNNLGGATFVWVQGQGYKDYIKDYAGKIYHEVDW